MTVRTWEKCVAHVKKTSGKAERPFIFLQGAELEKVQKCYCTMTSVKKTKNKIKKNGNK